MKKFTCLPVLLLTALLISCDDDETTSTDPIDTLTLVMTEHTEEDQMGAFAENAMVEFGGFVWSTGGYNAYSTARSGDVWKSTNGIAWQSVTFNEFEPRSNHTLTVYDDKMWLIGGIDNTDTFLGDVWNSSDGETWNLVTDTPAFLAASYHEVEVFNGKLFLLKDNGGLGVSVWSSSDGVVWVEETNNAFPSREEFETLVFNNELYVLGGRNVSTLYDEVWKSADGVTWNQVNTGSAFTPRRAHTSAVYKDKMWIVGGFGISRPEGNIWYSEDGINWFNHTPIASDNGLYRHASLVYNGEVWLFGGYKGGGTEPIEISGNIRSFNQITP